MDIIEKSIKAAEKEFREEPMDANYRNLIVGIVSRGRVKQIIKELGNLDGKTLLDAGCEAGHISMKILEKCNPSKIYAIDVCKEALDKFKSKKPKPQIDIRQGMIQELPYENELFDLILCTEVLEHAPNLSQIIKEFNRVLKPNGNIIITIPNEKTRRKLYPLAKRLGINTDIEKDVTLFEYNPKEIVSKLEENSFKVINQYTLPKLFPLTHFIIAQKAIA